MRGILCWLSPDGKNSAATFIMQQLRHSDWKLLCLPVEVRVATRLWYQTLKTQSTTLHRTLLSGVLCFFVLAWVCSQITEHSQWHPPRIDEIIRMNYWIPLLIKKQALQKGRSREGVCSSLIQMIILAHINTFGRLCVCRNWFLYVSQPSAAAKKYPAGCWLKKWISADQNFLEMLEDNDVVFWCALHCFPKDVK